MSKKPIEKNIVAQYIKDASNQVNKDEGSEDVYQNEDKFNDMVSNKLMIYRSKEFGDDTQVTVNDERESVIENHIKEKSVGVYRSFLDMKKFTPDTYCMYFETSKNLKADTIIEITSANTTHAHNTNGLYDKRLGPLHKRSTCATCYMEYRDCDGHSGWIKFPDRIPNPRNERDLLNTVKCICWHPGCFQPFASEEFIEILGLDKLSGSAAREALASYTPKLKELHKHGKYDHEVFEKFVDNNITYYRTSDPKTSYSKDIDTIFNVLANMSEKAQRILKFTGETKAESFIMEGIVLIPSRLRPAGFAGDMPQEHHITSKYSEIVKIISKLTKNNKRKTKAQLLATLYHKVKELFFGADSKAFKNADKSIFKLLSNKYGKIRRNGLGKRVDGSWRSTAGPHTECDVDQMGIPDVICKKEFIQEIVHMYNRDRIIQELKDNVYDKATVIIKGRSVTINLKEGITFLPELGNTVLRQLRDGDLILGGRQPSLHKASVMSLRVKRHYDKTIKLPQQLNAAKNADFDGDEFHGQVPFTTSGTIEMATLCSVTANMCNVESNKPMIAPAFHALLMGYYCTEKWVYTDELGIERKEGESQIQYIKRVKEAVDNGEGVYHEFEIPERRLPEVIACIKTSHRTKTYLKRCVTNGINPCSGRALLSLSFPTNLNYSNSDIEIKDGILIKGVLKSSNIGRTHNSLVQVIYKLFSLDESARFVSDFSRITDWLTMWATFSTGQQSFSTNREEIKTTLDIELNRMQNEFFNLGEEPTDEFDLFYWKRNAHIIADKILIYSKSIGNSYLLANNSLVMLHVCGGKGSDMNISQITALLGLQRIRGDFQKKELNEGSRILPTFLPGDCSLPSRFFVVNSFYDGMTPSEQFGHSSSAREGLLGTAAQTPDAGFTRRRISKSTENNVMDYKGQISSKLGKVYQFTYDGFAPGMEVLISNSRLGTITFFCDFKTHATYINGIYDYITKYMPEVDPDGTGNEEEEEEEEEDKYEFDFSNEYQPVDYAENNDDYDVDDNDD